MSTPWPNGWRWLACLGVATTVALGMLAAAGSASAQISFNVVHTFSGVEAPSVPRNLILAGDGNFYGISRFQGTAAIARLTQAGHISIVHTLTAAEGTDVTALLQAPDGDFYGTTSGGGESGVGTIFRLTPGGTYTILHNFSGRTYSSGDGARPRALLLASDGTFYGVTSSGGSEDGGTFFTMTSAGTVSVLHSFTNNPSTLMQASDGTFYGGNDAYDLFKITSSTALTSWVSLATLGASGYGPSTLIEGPDGSLYGTTRGFCNTFKFYYCDAGTAFKLSPAGEVAVLHKFETEGIAPIYFSRPNAPLVLAGDKFYGTTSGGGDDTAFKLTSSGAVTVLHTFTGGVEDGFDPASLVRSTDGSLYGTANTLARSSDGSLYIKTNILFRLATDDTFTRIATSFSDGPPDGAVPTAALLEGADGDFYGTTSAGGTFGLGTIFKLTRDGTLSLLHSFAGGADGAAPYAALLLATDGNFYGTTYYGGGSGSFGTIFRMTAAGEVAIVHRFAGGAEGAHPYAPLIQAADGGLYGTTFGTCAGCSDGIPGAGGTIFRMPLGGPVTTVRVLNANVEGHAPYAALVQGTDGNFYGSTTVGADYSGDGTIFRLTPEGALTVLHESQAGTGAQPHGALVQGSDGNFYGAMTGGGAKYGGTIFRITPTGSLTVLHHVDTSTDGSSPEAPLVQGADGNLYGVIRRGPYNGTVTSGTIFQITPTGVFNLLHVFTGGTDGASPAGGLVQTADGNFWGTTPGGGLGVGVAFRLSVTPQAPVFTMQPSNQTTKTGYPALFAVAVDAFPPPTFQWQVSTDSGGSWTDITESSEYQATRTSNLTVRAAPRVFDGYQFRVVASNTLGSAISQSATLTVTRAQSYDIVADFGPTFGVWVNSDTGAWWRLHTASAKNIVTGDLDGNGVDETILDFGSVSGIWVWANNSAWYRLHTSTADRIVTGDLDGDGTDEAVIDFPGFGIWVWVNNTFWFQLHTSNSNNILIGDLDGNGQDEAIVDFPGFGLWVWSNNASWFQLHTLNSRLMTIGDFDDNGQDDVIVDFAGSGLWKYTNNTDWSQFHGFNASHLGAGDIDGNGASDVIVDFGEAHGIWIRFNGDNRPFGGVTWLKRHSTTSTNIVVSGADIDGKAEILVDFGSQGFWKYANHTSWMHLHAVSPGAVATGHITPP